MAGERDRPHTGAGDLSTKPRRDVCGFVNAYYGKNYDRLVAVKTKYDPDNRLAFRQGIRPS